MLAVDSVTTATIAAPLLALVVGVVASEGVARLRGTRAKRVKELADRRKFDSEVKESLKNLTDAVLGTEATQWEARKPGLKEDMAGMKEAQRSMQGNISTLMTRTDTLVPNGGNTQSLSDRMERMEPQLNAVVRHLGLEADGAHSDS